MKVLINGWVKGPITGNESEHHHISLGRMRLLGLSSQLRTVGSHFYQSYPWTGSWIQQSQTRGARPGNLKLRCCKLPMRRRVEAMELIQSLKSCLRVLCSSMVLGHSSSPSSSGPYSINNFLEVRATCCVTFGSACTLPWGGINVELHWGSLGGEQDLQVRPRCLQ